MSSPTGSAYSTRSCRPSHGRSALLYWYSHYGGGAGCRCFAFAGAQVLGIGLLLGLVFGTPAVDDYASRTRFESARWKAENRDGAEGVRVRMVDDLLRTHKLVGMSRAQLEDLLGVPPATEYFRGYDYVYWLGRERGLFSIDSEWLVIKCGQGVVVSAQVVTD
jgi:hypothetical protein